MRFSEQYDSEASSRSFVHAHPRAYIINHVCLNNRITQTRLIRTYNDSVDSSFKHGRSVYRCFLQLQLFPFLFPFFFFPFSLLVEDLQRSERRKLKQEKVMPSHLSRRLNALTRHRRLGFERWKSIRIWIIIFSLRRSTGTFEYYRRPRLVEFSAIDKGVHRRSTVSNICNSCRKKENYLYSFSRFLKYKRILSRFSFPNFSRSCTKFLTWSRSIVIHFTTKSISLLNTRRVS